jgi:hypothetical protein
MININIEVVKKTGKTVSVRSLHKITISISKKISFRIFLKKFQGLFISGLHGQAPIYLKELISFYQP